MTMLITDGDVSTVESPQPLTPLYELDPDTANFHRNRYSGSVFMTTFKPSTSKRPPSHNSNVSTLHRKEVIAHGDVVPKTSLEQLIVPKESGLLPDLQVPAVTVTATGTQDISKLDAQRPFERLG
jgi:hypothetical protein